MPTRDLRQFLEVLRKNGELLSVPESVELRYELAEYLRQFDRADGPALLFERVKGHTIKVTGNLVGTRKRLALAFGLRSETKLLETYRARRGRRVPPRMVKDGPIKEVVTSAANKIDLYDLPVPIYHEGDSAPYITCGVVTAKDLATGKRGMGLHRIEIKGKRRLGIHLSNPPISRFAAEMEKANRPLDVAVSLGVHPVILLASIVSSASEDKVAIASSLLGSSIALVRCETSDVEAPARAEVVIEGRLLPNVREPEGPFGEISGYYFSDRSHVIEVTAITRRKEPILQALHPAVREVAFLIGPSSEAEIVQMLRERGFDVRDLSLSFASNRTHVALSLKKNHDAEPRQLLHFLLAGISYIKHAIVVDDDIDVRDSGEIEWAAATRFQGDRDLVVLSEVRGRSIDPSAMKGSTAKVGLDATVPIAEKSRFKKIGVPWKVREKVAGNVARLLR